MITNEQEYISLNRQSRISELTRTHALELMTPEYLTAAKEMYGIPTQENLRTYYVEHVWKYRDQSFTDFDVEDFLARLINGEQITTIVDSFL